MRSARSDDPDWRSLIPGNVYRQLMRVLKRAGLPHIRFHDLRHTAATLLLLKGVHPKKVSEILGHSFVAIALSIYSHVLPSMHRWSLIGVQRPEGGILWPATLIGVGLDSGAAPPGIEPGCSV